MNEQEQTLPPISADQKIPLHDLKDAEYRPEQEAKIIAKRISKKYLAAGILLGAIIAAGAIMLIYEFQGQKQKIQPSPSAIVVPKVTPAAESTSASELKNIEERLSQLDKKVKSIEESKEKLAPPPVLDFDLEFKISK